MEQVSSNSHQANPAFQDYLKNPFTKVAIPVPDLLELSSIPSYPFITFSTDSTSLIQSSSDNSATQTLTASSSSIQSRNADPLSSQAPAPNESSKPTYDYLTYYQSLYHPRQSNPQRDQMNMTQPRLHQQQIAQPHIPQHHIAQTHIVHQSPEQPLEQKKGDLKKPDKKTPEKLIVQTKGKSNAQKEQLPQTSPVLKATLKVTNIFNGKKELNEVPIQTTYNSLDLSFSFPEFYLQSFKRGDFYHCQKLVFQIEKGNYSFDNGKAKYSYKPEKPTDSHPAFLLVPNRIFVFKNS